MRLITPSFVNKYGRMIRNDFRGLGSVRDHKGVGVTYICTLVWENDFFRRAIAP